MVPTEWEPVAAVPLLCKNKLQMVFDGFHLAYVFCVNHCGVVSYASFVLLCMM